MAWRSGQSVPLISDLLDFAIGLTHSQVHNEELDSVEWEKLAVLKKNIASHQCLLDDMVPDGDCGLRAIVENVQRLNLSDPFALKVLAQLKQNGIGDACKLLRLKLCLLLKQKCCSGIFAGCDYSGLGSASHRRVRLTYAKGQAVAGDAHALCC